MKIKKKKTLAWNSSLQSSSFITIVAFYQCYGGILNETRVPCKFFFSFIWHNSSSMQSSFSLKLNFNKIEFQNGSTNLNNLEIKTYYQIFCAIWAKGQNLSYFNLDIFFFLMSQTSNHHVLVKVVKLCKNIKWSTEKVRSK